MVPVLRQMVLVLQERVACYAHSWHLTATALHPSLFIAEPLITLPFPVSFIRTATYFTIRASTQALSHDCF